MNNDTYNSTVTLGGYLSESVGSPFATHNLISKEQTWWTLGFNDISYGGTSFKSSSTKYAIVDTGTSLLYLSTSDYLTFVQKISSSTDMTCNS